ncbi:MAG TPA: ribonuclease H-like domain-containing protein [Spirochaetia bacterium]|nr:ribonuclease H-like domain-containing protein [Spirochaetia bacterium]
MSHELYERLRQLKARANDDLPVETPPNAAVDDADRTSSDESPPPPPGTGTRAGSEQSQRPAFSETTGAPGWSQVVPLVYRRETILPLPAQLRDFESLVARSVLLSGWRRGPAVDDAREDGESPEGNIRVGFYDTETTGLSGGAGSYIFLFGTGRVSGDSFIVEQYLLGDYPGEPEFISQIESRITQFDILVSYNGKAFDSHLLSTRFLMNGRSLTLPEQLDLLYPARSLYRSKIGPCGLSDVERELLAVTRELDVPGVMIPGIYFEFLRSADFRAMESVAAHHLEDIYSLLRLMTRIEHDLSPEAQTADIDSLKAAQLLDRHGHSDRARELLERNRVRGNSGWTEVMLLARLYLKAGRLSECEALWQEEFQNNGSVPAGIELAKLLEHRRRDITAAREVVHTLLGYQGPRINPWREALRHRLARLDRRISRSGVGGP